MFTKNGKTLIRYPSQSELSEYIIPSGVEILAEYAFCNSKNIKTLYIPNTLNYSNICVFINCINLENIYFNGTFEEWENLHFPSVIISFSSTEGSDPMEYAENLYVLNDDNEYYLVVESEKIIS